MSSPTTQRRADVDWIRVGAFGLLILYHVGLYYAPWDWHVHSPHKVEPLRYAVLVTNPWRLTLLFFISGVALSFMSRKFEPRALMRARFTRLVVPLIFGVLVLVPPQAWIEWMDKGTWHAGLLEFWFSQFKPERLAYGLPLNHLWFVLYIGVYSLAIIALFGGDERRQKVADKLESLLSGWRLLVLPIVYLALCRHLLYWWFGVSNNFTSDWYNHSMSLAAFGAGFLLAPRETVWRNFERLRWAFLGVAATALPLLIALEAHPGGNAFGGSVKHIMFAVDQWATIGAILGFGSKHLRRADGPVLRYLTEAVFPCYLAHQTILVACAYALKPANLPAGFEAALLVSLTLGGSLAVYEIVRRIEPLRPLWGLKPRRAAPVAPAPSAESKGSLSPAMLD